METKDAGFPITSVSRADLEMLGFDSTGVNDALMSRLADKLAEDYCERLFCDSLEAIAAELDIPRLAEEVHNPPPSLASPDESA